MKRFISTSRTPSVGKPAALDEQRRGSILVIVIALLGMLLLLGVAFYTFASQEHLSSGYFAETHKERLGGLSAETCINYALEQLIVGPSATQTQSALYGRTHSLVGNMLGINDYTVPTGHFDPVPYNGQGTNLALDLNQIPVVDQDFDNVDDGPDADPYNAPASSDLLSVINLSAAANRSPPITGPGTPINPVTAGRPQPDVGYTYPDINNLFLAYISNQAEDMNGVPVILPSFFRPQLLRDSAYPALQLRLSPTWYQDAGLGAKLLRPHPDHLIAGSTTTRFLNAPVNNVLGNPVQPFPFEVDEMGVWTGDLNSNLAIDYNFDADNDGDGIREGIWLDLGFPAQTLIDGRRYVPMFSYTVLDADGLINLNTAGNLNEHFVGSGAYGDAGSTEMQNVAVSTSNLGASRTEVNPLWAMWNWPTTPTNLTLLQQKDYKYFTNLAGSMSQLAIANMELIHIKNGQKHENSLGADEFNVGAWGELSALQATLLASPGRPGFDDDGDQDAGNGATTPLDLRGFGMTTVPTADGLIANLIAGPYGDPNRWLQYDGYLENSLLPTAFTTNSLPSGVGGTQIDEADETIVEPLMAETSPTIQADALFGPDEMLGLHLTNSEFTSVAGTSRLKKLAPINFASEAVRKQFTTTSFDRAEFGWTPSINRSWEQAPVTAELFPFTSDPFRPAVRDMLVGPQRFRLLLNLLLDQVNADGRPVYKELTSYSVDETLANQDRTALAQDIYLLLYSVGGGVDQDYSAHPLVTPYSAKQLEEMAQFAVNLVDAMDPDNVITIFNYDEDPGNGWSPAVNKRVFGVEAQELTLSEALVIRTVPPTSMMDDTKTTYDDTEERYYSYLELRNVSPFSVPLGPTVNQLGAWRIRVVNRPNGDTGSAMTSPKSERFLYLMPAATTSTVEQGGPIPPGGQLLIGSRSGADIDITTSKQRHSDFRVDYDGDNEIETIAPAIASGVVLTGGPGYPDPANPGCSLDLVTHSDVNSPPTSRYRLIKDNGMGVGLPINPGSSDALVDISFTPGSIGFVLERLANPNNSAAAYADPAESNNPWIPVDRMTVSINTFDVESEATSAALATKTSWERAEPFDMTTSGSFNDTALPTVANSLGSPKNFRSPTAFIHWQPHFDRPFSSVYELLSIPLYGVKPLAANNTEFTVEDKIILEQVTPNRLIPSQDMTKSLYSELTAVGDTNISAVLGQYLGVELLAAKKFLRPNYDDSLDPGVQFDNRWYRILSLVEVSTLTNNMVQWDQNSDGPNGTQWERTANPPRLPGAINLNTIRNRGVLASLIDDPDDPLSGSDPEGHLNPSNPLDLTDTYDGNRDWWRQFIISRDGLDSFVTNLYLPGLPGSRPYRNGGFVDQGLTSIQGALLREVVNDAPFVADGRNLFEARTSGAANQIDYHTRHRLLRKVANNSTNRSNVFIVYMTIAFFEAVDDSASGNVRIGAQLTALPEHRGFAIVDRTLLEKAQVEASAQGRRFDYKKFIIYQKTLK